MRSLKLNAEVRDYTEDWDALARIVVAEFNASFGHQFEDPWLKDFVDRLSEQSREFSDLWNHREVIPRKEERTRIHHKAAGRLYLERSVFQIPYEQSLSLVTFIPLEEENSILRLRDTVDAFRTSISK